MSARSPIIQAQDIHKWFDEFHALKGINLAVFPQEVVVLMGPSGSGKSTFIRTLNALEDYQKGQIIVDGIELSKRTQNIDAIRQEVGMVFQQESIYVVSNGN